MSHMTRRRVAITGIGLLPASALAGLFYMLFPSAPYLFGGFMSLAALLILGFCVKEKKENKEEK